MSTKGHFWLLGFYCCFVYPVSLYYSIQWKNENKNWYLPDFWNEKCDFRYFCGSQIFHLRNEDTGRDSWGPFLFKRTIRKVAGSRKQERSKRKQTPSSWINCSQGGHFPSSTNPSPYLGISTQDVPPHGSLPSYTVSFAPTALSVSEREQAASPGAPFLFLPIETGTILTLGLYTLPLVLEYPNCPTAGLQLSCETLELSKTF